MPTEVDANDSGGGARLNPLQRLILNIANQLIRWTEEAPVLPSYLEHLLGHAGSSDVAEAEEAEAEEAEEAEDTISAPPSSSIARTTPTGHNRTNTGNIQSLMETESGEGAGSESSEASGGLVSDPTGSDMEVDEEDESDEGTPFLRNWVPKGGVMELHAKDNPDQYPDGNVLIHVTNTTAKPRLGWASQLKGKGKGKASHCLGVYICPAFDQCRWRYRPSCPRWGKSQYSTKGLSKQPDIDDRCPVYVWRPPAEWRVRCGTRPLARESGKAGAGTTAGGTVRRPGSGGGIGGFEGRPGAGS